MIEIKYDECKLCFYRGVDNNCYEMSYVNGVFKEPKYMNINDYYEKGCKKLRYKKIDKLLNNEYKCKYSSKKK